MGHYALQRILITGSTALVISAATMPYAAHAGDADDPATNPMIREIMKEQSQSQPCGTGQADCGSASQPAASENSSPDATGNGGVKKRRPIPRRNFSDSVKDLPDPDCNDMNSDGLLMHGHWDSTKLKCVYDEPTTRSPAPHAKFN